MIPIMPRKGTSKRLQLLVAILLATVIDSQAPSAAAQQPPHQPPPTTSTPDPSHEERMTEARRQFDAGVRLLDDPDGAKYEEAYHAFKRAYELSQSSKVLGNIGFCALHLERDGEAIDSYTTYLRDVADISERERTQIQRDLETLTATVARVHVVVKRPGTTFALLDRRAQTKGTPVENSYPFDGSALTIRVRPGRHVLKVIVDNVESTPIDVMLEAGATSTYEMTFPSESEAGSRRVPTRSSQQQPSRVGPIIVAGVGVLALGTGLATGLVARSKANDISSHCPNDLCPGNYDLSSHRTTAKTFGTIADASFLGGGVLLAGALVWYLFQPKAGSAASTASISTSASRWQPSTACTRDGCSFQLQRGF